MTDELEGGDIHHLTQDDANELLKDVGVDVSLKCAVCSKSDFAMNIFNGNAVVEMMDAAGGTFPEVRLICMNCGYIVSFSAKRLIDRKASNAKGADNGR